jgi:hypothetical protein
VTLKTIIDSDWVKLFNALLTPTLAIIAAYIAYQQWKTNHLKVRHDLYERRLAIYFATMEFLSVVFGKAEASQAEMVTFLQKTREGYFLFGPDLGDYLNKLYNRAVDLRAQNITLNQTNLPVGDERTRLAKENTELLKWFGGQFKISQKKFRKYMRLS